MDNSYLVYTYSNESYAHTNNNDRSVTLVTYGTADNINKCATLCTDTNTGEIHNGVP